MSDEYPLVDGKNTQRISADRISRERKDVHEVLNEGFVCTVAYQYQSQSGNVHESYPVATPMLYGFTDEKVYLHTAAGVVPHVPAARLYALATDKQHPNGLPVCLTVSLVDALLPATTPLHHGISYRSVMIYGSLKPVTDASVGGEKETALRILLDHVIPGRSKEFTADDFRHTDDFFKNPMDAVGVLRLDLNASDSAVCAKLTRKADYPPKDPGDTTKHWSGIVPVTQTYGSPKPDAKNQVSPPPDYLTHYQRP
ncbi:pyridoxamine 5'-phosphate oxidase family protein [Streptomyces sp. NPDC057702]|uniref:pyridoxamine 5'-phosphate oxidase family protein n=1 Tax=unclassified Streptomyces TaxID=2593676 RepID=UPI0036CBB7D1